MAWILLCVLGVITLVTIFLPRWRHLSELQSINLELKQENVETEEETRALKRKQERFLSDPRFVERTARESGMVKPTETVFKFTNKQARVSSTNPR